MQWTQDSFCRSGPRPGRRRRRRRHAEMLVRGDVRCDCVRDMGRYFNRKSELYFSPYRYCSSVLYSVRQPPPPAVSCILRTCPGQRRPVLHLEKPLAHFVWETYILFADAACTGWHSPTMYGMASHARHHQRLRRSLLGSRRVSAACPCK